jgi:LuxR family maltose regulon positive regulatory protein
LDRWEAHRAVFVHAPAGYGKSILVNRWIDVSGLAERSAWLSLDERDGDPRRFLDRLAAAIDRCAPGFLDALQPMLRNRRGSVERTTARLLAVLDEALLPSATGGDEHLLLVLDDLHRADSPEVHAVIRAVLEHGPERLHLLIIARPRTVLSLARIYAHARILELDKSDLCFTEEEIREYLELNGFHSVSTAEIAQLTQRCHGWITGLQLAILCLRETRSVTDLLRTLRGDRRWLAQFLTEEVLDLQVPSLRLFLLQTSILDGFDSGLCAAVTGTDDAGAKLAAIAQADIFLEELDSKRGWFRYHQLFQELLQERLRGLLGADEVAELHRRAAAWLAADGQLESALRHLLAAGAKDAAADLAERHVVRVMSRDPSAAKRLFELLTEGVWELKPHLVLARGRLALLLDEQETGRYLDRAAELLGKLQPSWRDAPESAAEWLVLRSGASLVAADERAAAIYFEQALPHIDALDDLSAGILWFIHMRLLHWAGDHTALRLSADRALASFARADFEIGRVAVQRELARSCVQQGRSQEATRLLYDLLNDPLRDRPEIAYEILWAAIIAAENSYWQNDLVSARGYQQTSMALAHRLGDDPLILCNELMAAIYDTDNRGLCEPESGRYVRLERQASRASHELFVDLEIRRLIAAGLVGEAWEVARKTGVDLTEPPDTYRHQMLVPYLRAAIALGADLPGVTSFLEAAVTHQAAIGNRFIQLQLLGLMTWQQLKLRELDRASKTLAEAAGLARETGYVRVLLDVPELRWLLHAVDPELAATRVGASAARPAVRLTPRELQILELLAEDRTYQQISDELVVSINTVRTHVSHLYRKLSVRRRAQAAATAHRLGVLGD